MDEVDEKEPFNPDLLLDPQFYIESLFQIVNRKSQTVPLIFNYVQRMFYAGRSRRDVIVKARKMGFSAIISAIFLHACLTRKNVRAVVISHEQEATKRHLKRVKLYLEKAAFPLKWGKDSEHELTFPETNSSFWIGSAGQRAFGRGDDITHAHLSEFCHYDNPSIVTSVGEAMMEDSWMVLESTANGAGNASYNFWVRAVEGKSNYKPHFFAWFKDPEYRRPVDKPLSLDREERKLRDLFDLDDEQLQWRRWKLRDMADPDLFPQEYPSTWEEAFITAGLRVFDWAHIRRQEKIQEDKPPKLIGEIYDKGGQPFVEPEAKGRFAIWKSPKEGGRYLLSGDTSDGIPGADYACFDIWDCTTWEQVAQWHGYISPNRARDLVWNMGQYYNWAFVLIEDNYPGNVVNAGLEERGYPKMWVGDDGKYWKTTLRSKPQIVADCKDALGDTSLIINSPRTILEMKTFVKHTNGKLEAEKGCHDDSVMSAMLGAHGLTKMAYDPETVRMRSGNDFRKRRRGPFRDRSPWAFEKRGIV